ncbi:hypothetical protein JCM19992_23570 [Thermostilla marina]
MLPVASDDAHSDADEEDEDLTELAVEYAPPWLISAVFHMLLLIVLALIMIPQMFNRRIDLNAEIVYAEKEGEQLEFDSPFAGTDEELLEEPIYTPLELPQVEDPFAAPAEVQIAPEGTTSTSTETAQIIGYALQGREAGSREALLAAYGGDKSTQAAVELALKWLVRNQQKDGSWSLQGPYSYGANEENPEAATAMALLAFQGTGYTHKRGPYKDVVSRAWYYLLKQQDSDGCFFRQGGFNHRFYTHGQCAIAICELYGMTKDETLREPAEKAIRYIIDSQSPEGGWRYAPQADSDLSVTGWMVMALQSARMAGLDVPEETLTRIERFLDKVAVEEGSKYCYQRGRAPTLAMTAEGLLCRQYLGWEHDDPRLIAGVEWITQPGNLIHFERDRDVYYWYYATQVCHHMEGEYWERWNNVMRQELPKHQEKTGPEAGSWNPVTPSRDANETFGGRLYVTCLSVYMLEVYYRHLPLYSNVFQYLKGIAQ